MSYNDISLIVDSAYKLADIIEHGTYSNVFYFEFHEEIDVSNVDHWKAGMEAFSDQSYSDETSLFSDGFLDQTPSIIHIALKIDGEWFIAKDCGANFYLGFGPAGILMLRKTCAQKKIIGIVSEENFDLWIDQKFHQKREAPEKDIKDIENAQFERTIRELQYFKTTTQEHPEEFQGSNEEQIRNKMLIYLSPIFRGKATGESKCVKGKTDIMVKTDNDQNCQIFELKVWGGRKTLEKAIEQLRGYLSWHNNHCYLIVFCYNDNFTLTLNIVKQFLQDQYGLTDHKSDTFSEFRFNLTHPTDPLKLIKTYLTLITLKVQQKLIA